MIKLIKRISLSLLIIVLAVVLAVVFLRQIYLEQGVPKYEIESWVSENDIGKVLVIFAHQDDELLVSGTVAGLDAAGVGTVLMTITDGDGERRRSGQTIEDLVTERAAELQSVADILQVDSVEQGFFSDRGFMEVSSDDIKGVILAKIQQYQPDTIITWDTVKGLTGHPHHVRVGQLVVELCQEYGDESEFPVTAVYSSTVSVWLREILKKASPGYQQNYYEISDGESIEPEFSLATRDYSEFRRQAFSVYWKRAPVQQLNPLSGAPVFVEDFVFDREYFYQSY